MSNLIKFLTSKDVIIIYVIAGVLLAICLIVYLVYRTREKRRLRNNTRELNKLVDEIKSEVVVEDNSISYDEPVIQSIIEESNSSVNEMLDNTFNNGVERSEVIISSTTPSLYEDSVVLPKLEVEESIEDIKIDSSLTVPVSNNNINNQVIEDCPVVVDEPVVNVYNNEVNVEAIIDNNYQDSVEEVINDITQNEVVEEVVEESDKLEYTSIEPDPVTAQLELKKITEELRRQEEAEQNNVIDLTSYEVEQEENAIISLDELVSVGKDIYKKNELTQYTDEGNEPISLQELEKIGMRNSSFDEPFIIENVVDEEEVVENEAIRLDEVIPVDVEENVSISNSSSEGHHKFQNSPVISPIYGIEKMEDNNSSMELENTANYEKLDAEIKKTNEFLMTLKELQKNLD